MPEYDRLTNATQTAASNAAAAPKGTAYGSVPSIKPAAPAGAAGGTTTTTTVTKTEESPDKLTFGQQIRKEAKEFGQGVKQGLKDDFTSIRSYMDRLGEQRKQNIEDRRKRRETKAAEGDVIAAPQLPPEEQ